MGVRLFKEVSLGTRGFSLHKSGPDHSVTDHACPVDAQSINGEKHTGNSEWQNAFAKASPPPCMKIPEAKADVNKEWDKLNTLPAWETAVVQRAKKEGETIHLANLVDLCH